MWLAVFVQESQQQKLHATILCSCELFCSCYFQVLAQLIHCNTSMTAPHSTANPDVLQGTKSTVQAERQWQVLELKPGLLLISAWRNQVLFPSHIIPSILQQERILLPETISKTPNPHNFSNHHQDYINMFMVFFQTQASLAFSQNFWQKTVHLRSSEQLQSKPSTELEIMNCSATTELALDTGQR